MNPVLGDYPATEALEASVKRRRHRCSDDPFVRGVSPDLYSQTGKINFEMTSLYQEASTVMNGELLQFPTIVWLSDSDESDGDQADCAIQTDCSILDSVDSNDESDLKTTPKVLTRRRILKRKGSEAFGRMVRSKSLSKELSKLGSFSAEESSAAASTTRPSLHAQMA